MYLTIGLSLYAIIAIIFFILMMYEASKEEVYIKPLSLFVAILWPLWLLWFTIDWIKIKYENRI